MAPSDETTLSRPQARRVYDRIGALQDLSALVEDRANRRLIGPAQLAQAKSVLELGCGTGRFAARLLRDVLPRECRYTALDLSPKMRQLAQRRLAPYADRVEIRATQEVSDWPEGPFDVVLSTFVIDLLDEATIHAWIDGAHARLVPGGRLALSSMAHPAKRGSLATRLWMRAFRASPFLVGGCRPVDLPAFVPRARFMPVHEAYVPVGGIRLGVLVAARR